MDNEAGVLTDISADVQSLTINLNAPEIDVSNLGSCDKEYIGGAEDGTIDLTVFTNNTTPATFDILYTANGTSVTRTWEYAPYSSSGIILSGECRGTSFSPTAQAGDNVQMANVTLRITGAVTKSSVSL